MSRGDGIVGDDALIVPRAVEDACPYDGAADQARCELVGDCGRMISSPTVGRICSVGILRSGVSKPTPYDGAADQARCELGEIAGGRGLPPLRCVEYARWKNQPGKAGG